MARGILGRGVRGTAGWLWLPVVLAQVAHGFWPGECGGDPGRWALTDNHDLDCALRQLTLDRAVAVLGRDTSVRPAHLHPSPSSSLPDPFPSSMRVASCSAEAFTKCNFGESQCGDLYSYVSGVPWAGWDMEPRC